MTTIPLRLGGLAALGLLLVGAAPPVIGPTPGPDGQLTVTPTAQVSIDGTAVWSIRNGAPRAVEVAIELTELALDDRQRPAPGEALPGRLPTAVVHLGPGEAGRVTARLDPREAVALRATVDGASPVSAFALSEPDAVVRPAITVDAATGVAMLSLSSDTATVASVSVGARTFPARDLAIETLENVVVVPPATAVRLELPRAFGPTTIEAAVVAYGQDPVVVRETAWIARRTLLAGLAILLIAISLAVIWLLAHRRRPPRHAE